MWAIVAAVAVSSIAIAAPKLQPKKLDIVKLADGVYAFIWPEETQDPIEGNSLVVINDDDVLVVDTGLFPSTARRLAGEIKKLTDKPVRYVVTTHFHDDHHNGNGVYKELWPGVEFIAQKNTSDDIVTKCIDVRQDDIQGLVDGLALYEDWLKTGKDSKGTALTDARRKRAGELVTMYSQSIEEYKSIKDTPPDVIFDQSLELHRGSRTIQILWLGRGNTRGDAIVLLPKERIAAIGDLVVHPIPFAFGSYYKEWIQTLARVDSLPADVLVPGHGPVYRDRKYLHEVQALLNALVTEVKAAVADGASLEETQKRVTLTGWKEKLSGEDAAKASAFDYAFIAPAVERAWHQERGDPDE
jgi:glyoxylase-like metal-dependent hydrolase (beta-lactamase superfamily II)